MGRKVNLVQIPSEEMTVLGYAAQKTPVTIGDKRTLFLVFKSDDITPEQLQEIRKHLNETLPKEEGTVAAIFALDKDDGFEIHEANE